MTTEQMDWLDDERAGRHAPPKQGEQPKGGAGDSGAADELDGDGFPKTGRFLDGVRNGRGRWPFTPNPDDGVRPNLVYTDRSSAREAMAALGDPLDPMPDKWVVHVLADDDPRLFEKIKATIDAKQGEPYWVQRDPTDGDHTHYTREARDQCAAGDHQYAKLLDDAAEREKIAAHDEPSMIAAAGWCMPSSQVYNFLPTDEEIKMAKRERRKAKKARRRAKKHIAKVYGIPEDLIAGLKPGTDYHVRVNGGDETVMTTMAEEPIETRLRRAWLNGFKDGVDRASYAATESTGRWDY